MKRRSGTWWSLATILVLVTILVIGGFHHSRASTEFCETCFSRCDRTSSWWGAHGGDPWWLVESSERIELSPARRDWFEDRHVHRWVRLTDRRVDGWLRLTGHESLAGVSPIARRYATDEEFRERLRDRVAAGVISPTDLARLCALPHHLPDRLTAEETMDLATADGLLRDLTGEGGGYPWQRALKSASSTPK